MTRPNGFSLIEALVALAIASTILWVIAGWLWQRPGENDAEKVTYATSLLQEQLAGIIENKRVPPDSMWQEKQTEYPVWTVFFSAKYSSDETCVKATAVRIHIDTVSSMVGCFHE